MPLPPGNIQQETSPKLAGFHALYGDGLRAFWDWGSQAVQGLLGGLAFARPPMPAGWEGIQSGHSGADILAAQTCIGRQAF